MRPARTRTSPSRSPAARQPGVADDRVDIAGHVPANTALSIIDPLVKSFSDAINAGDPPPAARRDDNYWGNFGNAWADVLTAGADPTTALAEACTALDTANGK